MNASPTNMATAKRHQKELPKYAQALNGSPTLLVNANGTLTIPTINMAEGRIHITALSTFGGRENGSLLATCGITDSNYLRGNQDRSAIKQDRPSFCFRCGIARHCFSGTVK